VQEFNAEKAKAVVEKLKDEKMKETHKQMVRACDSLFARARARAWRPCPVHRLARRCTIVDDGGLVCGPA